MTQTQLDGYLALPKSGTGAGVLVLNAFLKDLCRRLARQGLVAFAPDLYHGQVATTIEDAKRLRSKLNRQQVVTDIAASVEYLCGLDAVTSPHLGVIGFSLGAYFALGLSNDRPDVIRAVVTFYGSRTAVPLSYCAHGKSTGSLMPGYALRWSSRSM